jgi:uncharacterized protein (DUF1501 family)
MAGTDDGGASPALVLGDTRYAGRIGGRIPDLDRAALSQGRHLPVATDLRELLTDLCALEKGERA